MGSLVDIDTLEQGASFKAYCARPAGEPKAAIVVIQEIFGVNPGIRKKCDDWAAKGYLAIAPDLFWRIEPGIELDADKPDDLQRAFDFYGKFDQQQGIADIEATIRIARATCGGGKVGAVGYCLGGRLAYMTAARTDIDATVGYYGVGLEGLLGESHAIARPLLLHVAEEDHFVTKDAQAEVARGLANHPRVTIHSYPGLDHGFAAEMGARRDEAGATLADGRTAAFFAEHLA